MLWEVEFKSGGLDYEEEKILKCQSTQAVAWVLLAAFNQMYYEHQERREKELKDLEKLKFG
jgi:hypothetical protein